MKIIFICFVISLSFPFVSSEDNKIGQAGSKLKKGMTINISFKMEELEIKEVKDDNNSVLTYSKTHIAHSIVYAVTILEINSKFEPRIVSVKFSEVKMTKNGNEHTYPVILNKEYTLKYKDSRYSVSFEGKELNDIDFFGKYYCLDSFALKSTFLKGKTENSEISKDQFIKVQGYSIPDGYKLIRNEYEPQIKFLDVGFVLSSNDELYYEMDENVKEARNILFDNFKFIENKFQEFDLIGFPVNLKNYIKISSSQKKYDQAFFEMVNISTTFTKKVDISYKEMN